MGPTVLVPISTRPTWRASIAMSSRPASTILALAALGLCLAICLPLFLTMPLWVDPICFDVQARQILHGEVLYRDFFAHYLPGPVWVQTGIRAVFGWRTETLRFFDFLFVAAAIWLLAGVVRPRLTSQAGRLWLATLLFALYFATSEWCHCQPDLWMLPPALAALVLCQKLAVVSDADDLPQRRRLFLRVVEGLCWGSALLFKPFVVVPAAACWLIWANSLIGQRKSCKRSPWVETACVVVGAVIVPGGACLGMMARGNWRAFLIDVFGPYNREYLSLSRGVLERLQCSVTWLLPWSLLHLVAVPLALATVIPALLSKRRARQMAHDPGQTLLAAFYLGWFVQANFIQRQFDYHLLPALLLAVGLLARQRLSWGTVPVRPLAYGFIAWCVLEHPCLEWQRLALWPRCCREGSTPELRDRLSLAGRLQDSHARTAAPSWVELDQVAAFLRSRDVKDRTVTCFDISTVPLYDALAIRPSTGYVMLWTQLTFIPSSWKDVRGQLQGSPQRYVVTDENADMVLWAVHHDYTLDWAPIAFQTERYLVRDLRAGAKPPKQNAWSRP